MLIDARQLREDRATQVCVVGAGPAGLAIAMHLVRNGIETVVLAGGGEHPDSAHQQLARVVARGIPTDDTMRGNIRALGGTSHVWGGYCLRMTPEDFERRAWIPHSGWPISIADVDPYYAKAAAFLAGNAPDSGPWAFEPEQFARGELLQNPILKNAVTHVHPVRLGARLREELHASAAAVLLYANAVELETDSAAGHVTAVRCRTLAGNTFRVRAGLVIVAAGAVQNARLMLLSRSANPAGIGNRNDAVGRYFMQHPEYRHGTLLTTDFPALLRLDPERSVPGVALPAAFTPTHQREHSLPSCHFLLARADYYAVGTDEGPWTQLRRRLARWRRLHARGAEAAPRWVSWLHRGTSSVDATSEVQVFLRPEQIPNPESRVSISDELDPLGVPLARMDWRLSEQDWEYADQCLSWFGCAVGGEGIGRVRFRRGAARESAKSFLHGGFHYYGTTRMSDDPRRGVVDRNCRVHGVDNLYMAGSSVFPTSGYANPTFTIVALALRLAEHLESRARESLP